MRKNRKEEEEKNKRNRDEWKLKVSSQAYKETKVVKIFG